MSDKPEPDLPMVRVDNPFPLLDKMIERGSDPEALGKMMDLAERWKKARAEEEFAEAMTACQRAMPIVVKDAQNKHTNSRYARLEEVNKTIKPCYTNHGFSVSFGEEDCPKEGHIRVVADVRHAGGYSVRYHLDMPMDGQGAKGGASAMNVTQAKGSTSHYGRRYLSCMIFNVTVADEDTDGQQDEDDPRLTLSQIETINGLLSELEELKAPADFPRFLAYMLGLEKGEDRGDRDLGCAKNSMYGPGVEMLMLKIAKAKKAGGK